MNTFQIFLISWIVFCIIIVGLTALFIRNNQNKKINMDTSKVTRVEVIDHQTRPTVGRAYAKRNCENVSISLQDEGRTLKIFIGSGGLYNEKEELPSLKYEGGSDLDTTVIFKDKEGNIGTIKPKNLDSVEDELKRASNVAKIMGDFFDKLKE